MNYFLSILPILLYLLGIKMMDAMSFTSWKRLCGCMVLGMACCGIAFSVTHTQQWQAMPDDVQLWATPLLEETLKALVIIPLVFNFFTLITRRIRMKGLLSFSIAFFAEAMVYGMAVGAGFALLENTLYVYYNADMTMAHCLIRGCGTALLHMGCTALVATILVVSSRLEQGMETSLLKTLNSKTAIIVAMVCAVAIHVGYNMFLIPAFIQLGVTVVVFLVIFMYLYTLEEQLINKWLDASISDDISLLGAIKDGNLATTRAGEYLMTAKERFRPETFFDMLVFLQLYLELSIKAKSRLILREAGMSFPIPPAEHDEDVKRIDELYALRHNIGMAGLSVLAPLIHVKNADKWVINELL